MKIILLKDVPKIGKKDDIKEVGDGYANNFLFPKKLAELATSKGIARIESMKKSVHVEKEIQMDLLMKNLKEISVASITIKGKTNNVGHLFAGIRKEDIVEALRKQAHISIDPDFIEFDKPLKDLGEHKIAVSAKGKESSFTLIIEKE
ncbi:MAG: 50S ribosomal protein L9 [Candidatus Paceibacterota bacterium]|jgi:large subunit ribosomal protein L9